jgi:Na+-transporting methylmalonyl-CoA/oxaloacetate decarboxylase gamma subunit
MSSEFYGSLIFLGLLLGGMWLISHVYMRQYRAYLSQHVDETRKLTEAQEATRAAVDRQTRALERIAAVIEARGRT